MFCLQMVNQLFLKITCVALALFFFSVCDGFSSVVINEIMYHHERNQLEYIELYNPTSESIDLAGWKITDNQDDHVYTISAGYSIGGGGYFLIANHLDALMDQYGVTAGITGISFNFSNDGDAVKLYDAAGRLIESVEYDDREPWPEAADGSGESLERINHLLPAHLYQSWTASTNGGSPGRQNTGYSQQLPPVVVGLRHDPPVPRPNQSIQFMVNTMDYDGEVRSVRLQYGWNRGNTYSSIELLDDGLVDDGIANNSIYGNSIHGGQDGDILRMYLIATDNEGLKTTIPTSGADAPHLLIVDNLVQSTVPVLRIVMRPEVREQFLSLYQTDQYLPASLYDGDTVYYSVHIRHRGRSRGRDTRFKVRFPSNDLYRGGIRRLNLNGSDSGSLIREYVSYQLYQEAGLPNLETEIVQTYINGVAPNNYPYRVAIENPDSQFLRRKLYFSNDDGNLYKTTLDGTPRNKATWRYVGDDPELYRYCYLKQTNEDEEDWSDIIRFCKVLNEANYWDPDFVQQVNSVLNADDFIKWMAVSAFVAHWDSPYTDHGHNYVLYHNPDTGQFHILAWDLNGTFNFASNKEDLNYRKHYTHIRSTKFAPINSILNNAYFGARYYREIDQLMNSLFDQTRVNALIDTAAQKIGSSGGSLKSFVSSRLVDLADWINRDHGMAFLTKPVYQGCVNDVYIYRAVAADYQTFERIQYELESAPSWLSVDPQTGMVQGTPTQEGVFVVVLAAKSRTGKSIAQSFQIQVVRPMPRLILNFNEPGRELNDWSEYAHTGQFRDNARLAEGRLGQGVALDGNNDYVLFPHSDAFDLTGEITVEAWIRPTFISNGNATIVTKGDANQFNYTLMLGYGPWSWDAMEPCFMPHRFDIENRVYYGRKEIEARLRARQWAHIAGTYDSCSELVCVYVNDYRIVESANRTLMPTNRQDLLIGLNGSTGFNGVVDDVKILPFAKQAFAAGLCISRVDLSGISAEQDRISISLSEHRTDAIQTSDFCLYIGSVNEWVSLPEHELEPGETVSWWLGDLGIQSALGNNGTIALYPKTGFGNQDKRLILDQVCWGENSPDEQDPGVQAGLWLPGRSIQIENGLPATISLREFCDNDDMDRDWEVLPWAQIPDWRRH